MQQTTPIFTKTFDFVTWLLLSIITCGIFAIYYEYKMAKGINEVQEKSGLRVNDDLALLCVLLAVFGVGIASIAAQASACFPALYWSKRCWWQPAHVSAVTVLAPSSACCSP